MTTPPQVWVIDDDQSIRWVLEKSLEQAGISVSAFSTAVHVMQRLEHAQPKVILTDIRMPDLDGITLLNQIKAQYPELPVIIMTAHSDLDSAVNAYQEGAYEYLPKPFDIDDAVDKVISAMRHARPLSKEQKHSEHEATSVHLVGESAEMQEVFKTISRFTNDMFPLLLLGEVGTGKETIAHTLHKHNATDAEPFVPLRLSTISPEEMPAELFGSHEKGLKGAVNQASGGTLYLDDIECLTPECQLKLLKWLKALEHTNFGCRLIVATTPRTEDAMQSESFNHALYTLLSGHRLRVPSLNQRREDIGLLIDYFLISIAKEKSMEPKRLLPETKKYLEALSWPGNVRQLKNLCRWLMIMTTGHEIRISDLPKTLTGERHLVALAKEWQRPLREWAEHYLKEQPPKGAMLLDVAMPMIESIFIDVALKHTRGGRRDAATLLGWGRNTLTRKIKALGLEKKPKR